MLQVCLQEIGAPVREGERSRCPASALGCLQTEKFLNCQIVDHQHFIVFSPVRRRAQRRRSCRRPALALGCCASRRSDRTAFLIDTIGHQFGFDHTWPPPSANANAVPPCIGSRCHIAAPSLRPKSSDSCSATSLSDAPGLSAHAHRWQQFRTKSHPQRQNQHAGLKTCADAFKRPQTC